MWRRKGGRRECEVRKSKTTMFCEVEEEEEEAKQKSVSRRNRGHTTNKRRKVGVLLDLEVRKEKGCEGERRGRGPLRFGNKGRGGRSARVA